MDFIKPERISLKTQPELNERWVQDRLAEDPSLLGLGDLILKDKERAQPRSGRLDLLFQEPDAARRYEVEIQLGRTDESHIIRTLEYWDIERKRYPQYDHCAVIVAEDITSRFLNIIGLFNGAIPLIAIQMSALKFGEQVALVFTTVLDELTLGFEEEEDPSDVTDRSYWEKRGAPDTIAMADQVLAMIQTFVPGAEFRYTKSYMAFAVQGQTNNFVILRARKSFLRAEIRLDQSEEVENTLAEAGFDTADYDKRWRRYRVNLKKADMATRQEVLTGLLQTAYENSR